MQENHLALQSQMRRRQASASTPHLTEKPLQDIFLPAANKLLATKNTVIINTKEMVKLLFNMKKLEAEHERPPADAQVISASSSRTIRKSKPDSGSQTSSRSSVFRQ
ncbi:hypothetical protein [Pseudoramibacter alactolyticus]